MLSRQAGPDALVEEHVDGRDVRCYARRPGSLVDVLDEAVRTDPDRLLLVDPERGERVDRRRFAALVEGAAATLRGRGLAPGDRVALLARNGLEAAVAVWACARAGLVHVGLPHDAPPARVAALVALTTPALVLAQPGLLGALEGTVVEDAAEVLLGRELAWDADAPLPDQDATYQLIPTSGTTGAPKAVRVTGRMAGHAVAFYVRALGLGPSDVTPVHLPFAWVSGSITQLGPALASGGSVVTMASFSAAALVRTVVEHGATWLDVVPSIWELLLREDAFALPALAGLRVAVFGGAPAPAGTLDRVRARLPQLRLVDVYALSETCAPVTCLPDVEALRRPGSVGTPVPYAQVRVVGEDGAELPRGEVGEVQVLSPATTPGYWGDAERLRRTEDGWLRTGDLARMDEEGYLFVGGRAVDLIIRGGVNVYPAEVERALLSTGQVVDAAAVGVPSTLLGQAVGAAVVALPGGTPDTAVLQRAVRDALGAHAVPRPLRVVPELPRGRNGKVDRAAVLAVLQERPTRQEQP